MRRSIWGVAVISALGLGGFVHAASTTSADDYWNGYWTWNDSSYRTYYSQYYSYSPAPYAYQGPFVYTYPNYGGSYGGYYPYHSNYRGGYYAGGPYAGYYRNPWGGGGMSYGWR